MEPYFINPVGRRKTVRRMKRKTVLRRRKATAMKKENAQENIMAKKRKSRKGKMPAALKAYWAKKRGSKKSRRPSKRRRSRKATMGKAPARRHKRARHSVRAHAVRSYRRAAHWSNPIPSLGQSGKAVVSGLVAVGVLFGALFAVGYVNGFKNRVPMLAAGWGSLAAKLAIGLGAGMAAAYAHRKNWLSASNAAVVGAAGFAPLGLDLLTRFAPSVAGQISLADDGVDAEMGASLSAPAEHLRDHTIDAEMAAEMGDESEMSAY